MKVHNTVISGQRYTIRLYQGEGTRYGYIRGKVRSTVISGQRYISQPTQTQDNLSYSSVNSASPLAEPMVVMKTQQPNINSLAKFTLFFGIFVPPPVGAKLAGKVFEEPSSLAECFQLL